MDDDDNDNEYDDGYSDDGDGGEEDERLEEARRCLDDQESARAVELLDELIAEDPEDLEAYDDRGLAYMQMGNDARAIKDFRKVIALDDCDEAGYTHLAEALRNLGKYDESLAQVARALDLAPDDADARYLRGWLFFHCGQYRPAIDDLDSFIRQTDDPGEVEDMLAVSRDLSARNYTEEETEKILRHNGFSNDTSRNACFVAEELFCPYAHCVRMQAARGTEAADCCPVTGFACPGGAEQARTCEKNPFA